MKKLKKFRKIVIFQIVTFWKSIYFRIWKISKISKNLIFAYSKNFQLKKSQFPKFSNFENYQIFKI